MKRLRPRQHRFAEHRTPAVMPRGFLRDIRGGATAIVAAAVTVLTLGGTALLGDHLWLIDQRDTLNSASEAATVAATLEIDRQLAVSRTDACAAAKSRGTEIRIAAAMHPDRVSSELGRTLRACSSESDREFPEGTRRPGTSYVFLSNATAEELETAFADIGRQLRNLRRIY